MNPITFEDVELMNLKVKCVSLLLDCPLHRSIEDCPFHKVREESVVTRVNWLKSLDAQRIMRLLAKHAKCMAVPAIPAEAAS
jgi:hypothetical protein